MNVKPSLAHLYLSICYRINGVKPKGAGNNLPNRIKAGNFKHAGRILVGGEFKAESTGIATPSITLLSDIGREGMLSRLKEFSIDEATKRLCARISNGW